MIMIWMARLKMECYGLTTAAAVAAAETAAESLRLRMVMASEVAGGSSARMLRLMESMRVMRPRLLASGV